MNRKVLLWLAAAAVLAVLVAYQTLDTTAAKHAAITARADVPTVAPGTDVLAGIAVLPSRTHRYDYYRSAYGDAWDDDNDAPGGHNGCDTRDDILDRDLVDKTYVSVKRCPNAVATGTLHDPYMGAYGWTFPERLRLANDPANLLAVQGKANQDKGDSPPAQWMPPNAAFACQYAMQFIAVLRGYQLPVDQPSAGVLRHAAATCPAG
jgi:hypothetical protein